MIRLIGAFLLLAMGDQAFSDDKLYRAIQKALSWKNYRFETHDFYVITMGGKPWRRFEDRAAKGIMQRFDDQSPSDERSVMTRPHWKYSVTMSSDYTYPMPGELNAPLNGDFVVLPGSGIDGNAYQRRAGESAWKKMEVGSANYSSVGSLIETEWLKYAFVQNFVPVQASGEFPIFGAQEVQGKKCIVYHINDARPAGWRFSYWLDKTTGDLVQLAGANGKGLDKPPYMEFTIVFLEPGRHASPRIGKP